MDSAGDLTLEGLVHDLNNVFETIQDIGDSLAGDPKYAKAATRLARSMHRANRILASYFEKSQASLDLELILEHAGEFANDTLQAVKGPQLRFSRNVAPGLRLRGNPAGWERVFTNLFLNAAQAMGEEGGSVEIDAAYAEGGAIAILIADDGPGISPKVLERIFEPRFSTRARRSGLGLHIVKTIVETAGGTVAAENRPGARGAQFRISLPAAQ
ncbi:MAG: HAMP domain-containing sensor histidine kinase [Bryobacteraceae bacterium]